MRVLIVEDEKRLAQALGQIMEEQHYQVDIVYDGADGLDYALSGHSDGRHYRTQVIGGRKYRGRG